MKFSILCSYYLAATTTTTNQIRTTTSAFSIQMNSSKTTTTSSTSFKQKLASWLQNSWIEQLSPETPENLEKSRRLEGLDLEKDENQMRRPVYNGHYVLVKPQGLKKPRLVLYSKDVATNLLGLSEADDIVNSPDFLAYVSGNPLTTTTTTTTDDEAESTTTMTTSFPSWATPYALSIMGTPYTSNCPYGTGNGYGDGRAISIGEFHGYELQLKGAGTTPFHRGADGRAVLRSSIREFLASEAMAALGVRTTRALSLVVSDSPHDMVNRPWYSPGSKLDVPSLDDPRIAHLTENQKRAMLAQLRSTERADPNRMILEPCAITCRVATSFTRVGHIDLFARRAVKKKKKQSSKDDGSDNYSSYDTTTLEWKELEQIIWHACYREYRTEAYDPYIANYDIASAARVLLEQAADRLSTMTTEWIRVGFAQGNFNGDNCLVGGHTMDYGPFGFVDEYHPLFAKWTGSGQHFGFMNQPTAGYANYQVLVSSVVPVIAAAAAAVESKKKKKKKNLAQIEHDLKEEFMKKAQGLFQHKLDRTFLLKMGFNVIEDDISNEEDLAEEEEQQHPAYTLWTTLEPLMRLSRVDYTLFWRQLSYVAKTFSDLESTDYKAMLDQLIGGSDTSPFYEPLTQEHYEQYLEWIQRWREMLLLTSNNGNGMDIAKRMLNANPKYILREWMMVRAYTAAQEGKEEPLRELYAVIQHPYEEGTPNEILEYYRRAPMEELTKAGTAFMS